MEIINYVKNNMKKNKFLLINNIYIIIYILKIYNNKNKLLIMII